MEYLIYASLVIITVLCLWVVITLPKNYLLKALLVPVMLLIAVSTWYTYNALFPIIPSTVLSTSVTSPSLFNVK